MSVRWSSREDFRVPAQSLKGLKLRSSSLEILFVSNRTGTGGVNQSRLKPGVLDILRVTGGMSLEGILGMRLVAGYSSHI